MTELASPADFTAAAAWHMGWKIAGNIFAPAWLLAHVGLAAISQRAASTNLHNCAHPTAGISLWKNHDGGVHSLW